MKLLIDMNLSPDWAQFLSNAGFHAVHWSALGSARASDAEIIAYARKHEYVIITHDLDFGIILAVSHDEKPSVVQIRSDDLYPSAIGKLVVNALVQAENDLDAGALVTIDPKRTRLRLLPLQQK
jgi:predicted nuclease of predicted toxin-antitoxin system